MADTVAILAGGTGTRFWPASKQDKPKQFLALTGPETMLQLTYQRACELVAPERILVLTNQDYVPLVREQLPQLPSSNVVGEPSRRDTAAAVCLASLIAERWEPGGVLAILTADHWIHPTTAFVQAIRSASWGARKWECLYTFGVRPAYPATGYGYLELGEALASDSDELKHHRLAGFKEKPNLATASSYVESGQYCWNSGMFVWRTSDILAEFRKHLPAHLEHLEPIMPFLATSKFGAALSTAFDPLERISVDYAILERARQVHTVLVNFDWSDLGGWSSLRPVLACDASGNAYRGRICALRAGQNIVFSEDEDELVALIGVSNLAVVRSEKTTLVASLANVEEVKQLVERLESRDR
ncbi:MAG: mannose-1-phosphate guanylyltransferase [Vulcanimicrobiota bacterium]